jgi:glucokinase
VNQAVIGVDLGGTNVRAALVDCSGTVSARLKEPTLAKEGSKSVVARLAALMLRLQESAREQGKSVVAVGVGAPGVILGEQGVVVQSPNFPDWNNLPLRKELETAIKLAVRIENDANAAALGEQWLGAARGVESMILLTLGTGVGGGIILNKQIWQGADGMAGEIGHMTVVPDGRKCGCGNTGCLEMYASARGIVQNYRDLLQSRPGEIVDEGPTTSQRVYEAAQSGDTTALAAMRDMGCMLGIGIASLVNIFNPEMIVIGGGVKDAWPLFIDHTKAEVRKRAFAIPANRAEIVPARLGDDAGMLGAAAVAFRAAGLTTA